MNARLSIGFGCGTPPQIRHASLGFATSGASSRGHCCDNFYLTMGVGTFGTLLGPV
jgi:hypothetical protein